MKRRTPNVIIKQDDNFKRKNPSFSLENISGQKGPSIFYKEGPPTNTDDIVSGYTTNCIIYDKNSDKPYNAYKCINDTENEAEWELIEKEDMPSNLGTAALRNIGEEEGDVPLFRYVMLYVQKMIKGIKFDIPIKTQDDLIDGEKFKRFSKEEKDKLQSIQSNADITNKESVKSSGAVMKDDDNALDFKWVIDDESNSNKLKLVPTYRLVVDLVFYNLKKIQELIFKEINKNNLPNSIPKCDKSGESMPLLVKEISLIGRMKGKNIEALNPHEVRQIIKVEEYADKTTPEMINNFGFINKKDETLNDCNFISDHIPLDDKSDNKLSKISGIKKYIFDFFMTLNTDHIKEGSVHKYFSGKTLDQLSDGSIYKRINERELNKLIRIEEGADVTNFDNVKKSGATMNTDKNIEGNFWVIHEDDMKSDSTKKVPSQKSVKSYVDSLNTDRVSEGKNNKYFSGKSTDDLPEGKKHKYMSDKTTDNLPEGEVNKYFNDKNTDNLPEGKDNKYFNNKTSDDLPEGKTNKYFNDKSTDHLPEGLRHKYFNNKTSDDLPEGEKNKYFRVPSHDELKDVKGGEYHLTEEQAHKLLSGNPCNLHCHSNIESFKLKDDGQFNGYKAIAMCCDNGSIFPKNPKPFQWFFLNKKAYKVLYQFDGLSWRPIISFGHLYISIRNLAGQHGHDNIENQEDESTFIFNSVDFALKSLPQNVTDDVFICFDDASIHENGIEFISNISFQNNSKINFVGQLNRLKTGIQSSSNKGHKDIQGSITHYNEFKNYKDKLLYSSNNDELKLIDREQSDTIFTCGSWEKQPQGEYKIYDWGTTIDSDITIKTNIPIYFVNIKFKDSLLQFSDSEVLFLNCHFDNTISLNNSNVKFCKCKCDNSFIIKNHSNVEFISSKINLIQDKQVGLDLFQSTLKFKNGCILDGNHLENTYMISANLNSVIDFDHVNKTLTSNIIRNSTLALNSNHYCVILNDENCKFIDNECDKNIVFEENGLIRSRLIYLKNGEIINVIPKSIYGLTENIDEKLDYYDIPETEEYYPIMRSIIKSLGKVDSEYKGKYYIQDGELYERENWNEWIKF